MCGGGGWGCASGGCGGEGRERRCVGGGPLCVCVCRGWSTVSTGMVSGWWLDGFTMLTRSLLQRPVASMYWHVAMTPDPLLPPAGIALAMKHCVSCPLIPGVRVDGMLGLSAPYMEPCGNGRISLLRSHSTAPEHWMSTAAPRLPSLNITPNWSTTPLHRNSHRVQSRRGL